MPKIVQYAITEEKGDSVRDASNSITEKHVIVTDVPVTMQWILDNCQAQQNHECENTSGFYWDRISPNHVKRLVWEVDCVATPFQWEQIPDDPLQRAAVITATGSVVTEPANFDWVGKPIVTTAGEWIGGVMLERGVTVYHVQKNIGSDPDFLDEYNGACNLDPVTIRGKTRRPGTLKFLNPVLGAYSVENRVRFCTLDFDLHWDPRGHWIERLNMGTLQLFEVLPKQYLQIPILSGEPLQPVEKPVPLDIRGQVITDALKPSSDGKPFDTSKLVKLKFQVQPLKRFNGVLPLK